MLNLINPFIPTVAAIVRSWGQKAASPAARIDTDGDGDGDGDANINDDSEVVVMEC